MPDDIPPKRGGLEKLTFLALDSLQYRFPDASTQLGNLRFWKDLRIGFTLRLNLADEMRYKHKAVLSSFCGTGPDHGRHG